MILLNFTINCFTKLYLSVYIQSKTSRPAHAAAEQRDRCSLSPVPDQFRISVEFLRALYNVQHM